MTKLFWTPPEVEYMCGRPWTTCYAWSSQEDADEALREPTRFRPLPVLFLSQNYLDGSWEFRGSCDCEDDLAGWLHRRSITHGHTGVKGTLAEVKQALEELLADVDLENPLCD